MNRRIRKKKRVGEFTQYGFQVNFNADLPEAEEDALIDGMIEVCEANHLAMGGGGGKKIEGVAADFEFFIVGVKPRRTRRGIYYRWRTCTDAERELLRGHLETKVANLVVGPLVDSNH